MARICVFTALTSCVSVVFSSFSSFSLVFSIAFAVFFAFVFGHRGLPSNHPSAFSLNNLTYFSKGLQNPYAVLATAEEKRRQAQAMARDRYQAKLKSEDGRLLR